MENIAEVITNTKTLNTNSVSEVKNTNTKTLTQVTQIANSLSDKLNNPSRFDFYCKVAWRLPESTIWNNLEAALKGRDPQRLFSYLCAQSLGHDKSIRSTQLSEA